MNILQKHTAQYFGTMYHGIKRSGKVIYTVRGAQLQRTVQEQHEVA